MWQLKKLGLFFLFTFTISLLLYLITKTLTTRIYVLYETISEYECGFESFDNMTRQPFDLHFYIVGIVFLLFDVEIAMLFPWVYNFFNLTWGSFFVGLVFITIIIYGIIYEWWCKILEWSYNK